MVDKSRSEATGITGPRAHDCRGNASEEGGGRVSEEDIDDDLGPGRCDMCGDRLDQSEFVYWTDNGEVCECCYQLMKPEDETEECPP